MVAVPFAGLNRGDRIKTSGGTITAGYITSSKWQRQDLIQSASLQRLIMAYDKKSLNDRAVIKFLRKGNVQIENRVEGLSLRRSTTCFGALSLVREFHWSANTCSRLSGFISRLLRLRPLRHTESVCTPCSNDSTEWLGFVALWPKSHSNDISILRRRSAMGLDPQTQCQTHYRCCNRG